MEHGFKHFMNINSFSALNKPIITIPQIEAQRVKEYPKPTQLVSNRARI